MTQMAVTALDNMSHGFQNRPLVRFVEVGRELIEQQDLHADSKGFTEKVPNAHGTEQLIIKQQ